MNTEKNEEKKERDEYVIVSMNNLYHIFDTQRTSLNKKADKIPPESNRLTTNFNDVVMYETQKTTKTQTKDFLFGKAESNKKKKRKCCDYFFNLVLFVFILLIFNGAFVWILYYMISQQKNHFYCFDSFSKDFKICQKSDFCPSDAISNYIYTDKISNLDIANEAMEINKKYLDFYIKDSGLFSLLNSKFSKSKEIMSFYTVVIVVTKNENFLFSNTFRTACDSNIIDFIITLLLAMVLGNFCFGYLADIFGRKNILIAAIFAQVLGGMVIFAITFHILYQGEVHANTEYINKYQMFNFTYENYPQIVEYVTNSSMRSEFETSNLNKNYKLMFNEIKKEMLSNDFIRLNYKKYKLFFFLGLFLIFIANSPVYCISLAYLLENALSEDSMLQHYLYFHFSYPLGILVGSLLCTLCNSFHIPFFILSCVQFIMIFILMFGFFESQRFNFEYSFYTKITQFTEYILGKDDLAYNYRDTPTNNMNNSQKVSENKVGFPIYFSVNSDKVKTELAWKEKNEKASFWKAFSNRNNFTREKLMKQKSKKFQVKKEGMINREEVLQNPFTINEFMKKEKQIKNHLLIIFSFVSSISIIMNLTFTKVTSKVFLPREKLLDKTVLQTWILGYCLLFYCILFPFIYFLVQFLGISIVLFPSLVGILIFSGIFEMIGLLPREQVDLNSYIFDSFEISFRDHSSILIACNVLVLICSVGLMYSLYFYLTKLTRTAYRCSFYGICQIFNDITVVISIGLDQFIEKTYFYACLFCIIGIINSYFITSNEDSLNITEIREIHFDERKNTNNKLHNN